MEKFDKQAFPNEAHYYNLQHLNIAKYLFRLRAKSKIELPPYKGSTLHGGFGHALKKISPFYYQQLCNSGGRNARPAPFVLLPPLDTEKMYPPGYEFSCELTLFGTAIPHFSLCHAALEHLGLEMGFGNNRGKFEIINVEMALLPGGDPHNSQLSGVNAQTIVDGRKLYGNTITLHFPTRLRLKADGKLQRKSPSFRLFIARLIGRLNTLSKFYCNEMVVAHDFKNHLLDLAENIKIINDNAVWKDLPRFSGRQQQWMKFGGLLGSITYEGDFAPFLPALALGEWTHTGGKTSFGLGKFIMAEEIEND